MTGHFATFGRVTLGKLLREKRLYVVKRGMRGSTLLHAGQRASVHEFAKKGVIVRHLAGLGGAIVDLTWKVRVESTIRRLDPRREGQCW